jgi:hypothetical protein
MTDTGATGETLTLRQTLGRAVTSAVNLRVITMVGDVSLTGSADSPVVTLPDGGPAAYTNINLLQGDILTCISPTMATGDLAELKAFHDGMVAKAEGIVERNVRLLKELISAGFDNIGVGGAP